MNITQCFLCTCREPAHLGVWPLVYIHSAFQATVSHLAPDAEQLRSAKPLIIRAHTAASRLVSDTSSDIRSRFLLYTYTAPMLAQGEQRQRKRGRDKLASEECSTLARAKRQKRGSDNYPPAVWDNLSKITLTRKALREFDRRTREHRHPQAARGQKTTRRILRSDARRLPDFASNGGPDLSPLRGVSMQ